MKKATFEKLVNFLTYSFQSTAIKYVKAKVVPPVTPELEKVYQVTKLLVWEMGRIVDSDLSDQVLEHFSIEAAKIFQGKNSGEK